MLAIQMLILLELIKYIKISREILLLIIFIVILNKKFQLLIVMKDPKVTMLSKSIIKGITKLQLFLNLIKISIKIMVVMIKNNSHHLMSMRITLIMN